MSDELRRAFDNVWRASERRIKIRGRLGKPDGDGTYTVKVSERPGFAYVRLGPEGNQGITTAFNLGVPYVADLPVEMRRFNAFGPLVIIGVDSTGGLLEYYAGGSPNTYSVAPHTHAINSGLEYEIEALRLEPGRVRFHGGMEVYINEFRYFYNNVWETWPGGLIDLTSYQPATSGNWAWVLVGIDPTDNTTAAVAGDEYSYTTPLTIDLLDDIIFIDYIPCAGIRIREDDSTVGNINRYQDAHGWFNWGGSTSTFLVDLIMTDADGAVMVDADGNVMIES